MAIGEFLGYYHIRFIKIPVNRWFIKTRVLFRFERVDYFSTTEIERLTTTRRSLVEVCPVLALMINLIYRSDEKTRCGSNGRRHEIVAVPKKFHSVKHSDDFSERLNRPCRRCDVAWKKKEKKKQGLESPARTPVT